MKIKEFRLKNGYSQTQISKLLGLSSAAYGHYETGRIQPSIETLIKLAEIFHTTVDALLGHEVPYLLGKSTLTAKQRSLAELLPSLSDYECEKAEAYIYGLLAGQRDRLEILQKFKK